MPSKTPSLITLPELYKNIFIEENYLSEKKDKGVIARAKDIIDFSLDNIKINKDSKIIDVGSGSGWLSYNLKDRLDLKPLAVDFSGQAAKLAKKIYGIDTKIVDFDKSLPFNSGSFDAAFCIEVIEHVADPNFLLQEIRRILKPRGYLILTTPNLASYYNRLLLLAGFQPLSLEVSRIKKDYGLGRLKKRFGKLPPSGHLRLFTRPALMDILKDSKFSVVAERGLPISGLSLFLQAMESSFAKIPSLSSDLLVIGQK